MGSFHRGGTFEVECGGALEQWQQPVRVTLIYALHTTTKTVPICYTICYSEPPNSS
jgi:hypothetical protein